MVGDSCERRCVYRARSAIARIALVTLVVMAMVALTGGWARGAEGDSPSGIPTVPAAAAAVDACRTVFGPEPFGATPSEGIVSPGDPLSIDVTWGGGWKPGQTLDLLSCTAVDGVFSEHLSVRTRAAEDDGVFVHDFRVPSDAPDGATVCQRAVVIGQAPAGAPKAERLEPSCFTVNSDAASPPRSTTPDASANGASPITGKGARGAAGSPAASSAPSSPPAHASGSEHERKGHSAVPAPPTSDLARTGPAQRILFLVAGVLLLMGGWAVAVGRPVTRLTRWRGSGSAPKDVALG